MTKRQTAAHITQQDADTISQGPPAHVTEGIVSLINDLNILFLLTIQIPQKKKKISGKSLLVQWLGLHASMIEGMGSILGKGTKSPTSHLVQTKNKIRFKK